MDNHKIDVDDAVWELLKKNAESSGESPNDILKRLLSGEGKKETEQKPVVSNQHKDWQCS
jgi:negative regulator of replication initiation